MFEQLAEAPLLARESSVAKLSESLRRADGSALANEFTDVTQHLIIAHSLALMRKLAK